MRRLIWAMGLALAATSVHAADKPLMAPPESWVLTAPMDKTVPTPDAAAIKFLLEDQQVHFTSHGDSDFQETRVLIQTAQGLGAMGTLVIPWNPETDTLTIHRLQIIRGDQVIDVLAKQSFTVVRRETNLEMAMLDGQLTAVIQPEGLQVGDVLDLAFTLTRSDPVLAGRSEMMMAGVPGLPINRLRLRALWEAPKTMRWRATDGLDGVKLNRVGSNSTVLFDAQNVLPLHPPEGAPARFSQLRQLEFTEFGGWSQVADLMRPLYLKSATLRLDSPLKAEIDRIRAASSDPKIQAQAALALVQDQVRYVFLGMNDGGLVPATADETWTRRFGDCKAKTVLLLALLNGLGITAQPALVSTQLGDGLDLRLPNLTLFDHVMIRAVIGGKTYWLDGTRTGDTALDRLRVPPFFWALPIGAPNAALERLTQAPLDQPDMETSLDLDASGGLDAPAPAHAKVIFRGDAAVELKQKLADLSPSDLDRALRGHWTETYDFIDVSSTTASFDATRGEERLEMNGSAKMAWDVMDGSGVRRYEADGASLGWKADFTRQANLHPDAPYAVDFPTYAENRETIRLPNDGQGFSIDSVGVDTVTAGRAFKRETRIDKGVFILEASTRSVAPEFPASEAKAAAKALSDMDKSTAYVRAPSSYRPTDKDVTALEASEPSDVAGYLTRARALVQAGDYAKALADCDRAVVLDGKSASALAERGWVYYKQGQLEKATADLSQAIALDPNDASAYASRAWVFVGQHAVDRAKDDLDKALSLDPRDTFVLSGAAAVARMQGRNDDAVDYLTRELALSPNDPWSLENRASLYWSAGDTDHALADLAQLLTIEPKRSDLRLERSEIYHSLGQMDKALAEVDAAVAQDPKSSYLQLARAGMLGAMGRRGEARQVLDAMIAKSPSANAYLTRATYREKSDVAGRLADIDAAVKLAPTAYGILVMRAKVQSDVGDFTSAARTLTEVLDKQPLDQMARLARAGVYAQAQKTDLALKDFADVRAKAAGDGQMLNNLCYAQATADLSLDAALADCDAALKLSPKASNFLDSRAFVLLRLGRLDDAIAGFDGALKLRPGLAESLFCRGIAKLRKGLSASGQADLIAARAISPDIDVRFAEYGIKP